MLAGRVNVGTLFGSDRMKVPADERFYAGGVNSIRGYRYESVSPLRGHDPIGGKSLLTFSGEFRVRARARLDLIAFVDGGNTWVREIPEFSHLRWGAGLGACYRSKVGPIRVDVAVPLNPRNGVDDAFQVYVTLGNWF